MTGLLQQLRVIVKSYFRPMTTRPLYYEDLRKIAHDTLERTPSIIAAHADQGATDSSEFIASQLPPLDPPPASSAHKTTYRIVNSDSFTAARELIRASPDAGSKTAVLNLASDQRQAGGWLVSLSKTQEEALCYSSTLYATLKESYYPWPNLGEGSIAGVYSPGVVVFKDDLDHGCVDLDERERVVVAVLTVAAPRGPRLTKDRKGFEREKDLRDLRGKIRLVYRMAARNGKEYVVLGAMGCGAYRCPPHLVAEEMKAILLDEEFKNAFHTVVFAVYSKTAGNPDGNYDVFKDVLEDILSD